MRKKTAILLSLILTLVIIIPIMVYAQMVKQAECCRLSQDVKMDDVTYGEGADCAFVPDTTTFAKDKIVGGGDCVGATVDTCHLKGVKEDIDIESAEWGTICLLNSLYNVTNWIFFFFLAIAILIGVLAGYMFMTATGDPGKVEKARNLLMYMVIGLIVAAVAKVIPTLVRTVVGF